MKRYCIFSAQYLPHMGGVERYTYNMAKFLAKRGNLVTIVTSNTLKLEDREKNSNIEIIRLPSIGLLNGRFPVLVPTRKFFGLQKELRKSKYDLIIVNTRLYIHSLYGVFFAHKEKTECIVIDHGTSHMTMGNKILDCVSAVYEHVITFLEKKFCNNYYGVSKEVNNWLMHFNIQAKGVLYNCVDMDYISSLSDKISKDYRKKLKIDSNSIIVTYTGRLIKEKGILQLVEAIGKLRKKGENIYLIVAGDGELLNLLKQLDKKYVLLLGKIEFEKVIELLNETDIFCLPSAYPEGFPTSTLEAGACKCYPIVTEHGGAGELILDESYGTIIKNNEVDTIVEALERAINTPEDINLAKQKLYQRIKKEFTWDKLVDEIEQITDN